MGRMALRPRDGEVEVMRVCFSSIGIEPIGSIPEPHTLEGGDFIPAGEDLCFLGVGIRTTIHAAYYMLQHDLFGTRRVAVVRDCFEQCQYRMHLDTVFNIASNHVAFMLEDMIGRDKMHRRLVTEFTRINGEYQITRSDVEFYEYVIENGYEVIPISNELQLQYVCNFLNAGDGHILASHPKTKKLLESSKRFTGQVEVIPYEGITAMYGGLHCSTQVFRNITDTVPVTPEIRTEIPSNKDAHVDHRGIPSAVLKVEAKRLKSVFSSQSSYSDLSSVAHRKREKSKLSEGSTSIPDADLQVTDTVLLMAPTQFRWNEETATELDTMPKTPQQALDLMGAKTMEEIRSKALAEFSILHMELAKLGLKVHLYTHLPINDTPDAVFVRNWFSTHSATETHTDSTYVLYPIKCASRRRERRHSIIEALAISRPREINLSKFETGTSPYFLEGLASLVLDRVNRIAYALVGHRTDPIMLGIWAKKLDYDIRIMHSKINCFTGSMLFVGTTFAILCDEILEPESREEVIAELRKSNRDVILISDLQRKNFCANVCQLKVQDGGTVLVMSSRAYSNFSRNDLRIILSHVNQIVHLRFDTIEKIGGSSVGGCVGEIF
jgi:hypothetical protein